MHFFSHVLLEHKIFTLPQILQYQCETNMNNASHLSRLHPPTGPLPSNASICPTSTSSFLCLNSFLSCLPASFTSRFFLYFFLLHRSQLILLHCPSMFLLLVLVPIPRSLVQPPLMALQPVLLSRVLPVKDNSYVHMLDCSVQI